MSRDRGSVTVVAAAQCLALLFLFTAGLQLSAATLARHRAEGAADLAALAAAAHIGGQPCEQARRVVIAMGGSLDECRTEGAHARVRVSTALPWSLGSWERTSARAHSGPVDDR